jgi:hypothetical protein
MSSVLRETVFISDAYVWASVRERAWNCHTSHGSRVSNAGLDRN